MAQESPLTLSAGYTVQTDSNLFRLPSNANVQALTGQGSKAENIGVTTLGIGFNTQQSLQKFEFDLSLVDYRYQNFNYLSFTASNYSAAWRWALTPRWTGNFTSDRKETLNSFSDYQGYTQRNLRVDTTTRLDTLYELDGPWRALAGASTTRQSNQQALTAGGDYAYTSADGGLRYAFASGSSITYQARIGNGNYLNRTIPNTGQFDDSFKQIDNDLRLRWVIGGGSVAEIYGTHINRTHPNYSQRDYNGFNTGANLNWALSGKSSVFIGFSHTLDAYATANTNYSQTDKFSIGPLWQFSPKASVRLRHDWAQRSYLGAPSGATSSDRSDITRDTSLSIDWAPHQKIALSAGLQSATRGSNQAGLDYESTVLFLTAQLNY
ncbi:exopolysaccharide biosynthesis operon protein EpsL [Rhodoferax saidenbachensis]|uniref:Exopolysaccharide biosynthesis operon protein EpsL n=2 Tax=Rhodoferax saidenbachensis TaxID=1484693 RepID=A0ABU1ZJ87_9BURK|nr:XrtB/PEP-CTERM-associated polysaccharide biosynthesis outer membrane protein EpsL [Rhodoferax saidenbachensis]MDR7305614.1 exopolysaccharide biosynthesis operon protein EpsL [Rhodoferax saidenbachensis]